MRILALALLVVAALAAPAGAAAADLAAPVTQDGPGGRSVLGGSWLLKRDPGDHGLARHWERSGSTAGWARITVPHAYNTDDRSSNSFIGAPAWYRTDFRLPSAAAGAAWRLYFYAVNYRATVWLNGRLVGEHAGGFEPFELPLRDVNRTRTNRLVVRVDNRRLPTDFPPSVFTNDDVPEGGWWNYGGIVREVELRRVDRLEFERVSVRAQPTCAGCPAVVDVKATLRNVTRERQRARLAGTFGGLAVRFGSVALAPGRARTLRARQLRVPSPRLWSPADPYLYPVSLSASASAGGRRPAVVGRYSLQSGIRSIVVGGDGRLRLNGAPVDLRGVALHEDMPGKGPALTGADRLGLVASIKDIGATLVRSHYPLHPAMQELADRTGLLIWSEVPVYRMSTRYLRSRSVRSAAVETVRRDVLANENHPSVIVWSIANELDARLPAEIRSYIGQAAAAVRKLDRSRPVGMAFFGHPTLACRPGLEPLDVLGVNDYFGWYGGDVASRDALSPYLDQMRACHPRQAMMVTEFGAEANRDGPVTEKGTYAFQQDFVRFQLGVFGLKPWLSGAIYWTLREFYITPTWRGGNPKPTPPLHQKGLISYAGVPKPAYVDVQASFRATPQLSLP